MDAKKPLFFSTGTDQKHVDIRTGSGVDTRKDEMVVYSGGDHNTVTRLMGARGPNVFYCGDHLFGDVVRCRKLCEWRTMLVVPGLEEELKKSPIWNTGHSLPHEG